MATYIASHILPWLIGLPVLITLLILAARQVLKPIQDLSAQMERRKPDDATPLLAEESPGELKGLVLAMKGLLGRVATLVEQERHPTAAATHELRTPLAALRSQWDVAQRTQDPSEQRHARTRVTRSIERLDRLVFQLLIMARLDNINCVDFGNAVDWRAVAEQAVGDCLCKESGSGLGVSIARRIAQNHGLILQFVIRDPESDFGSGLRVAIRRGS